MEQLGFMGCKVAHTISVPSRFSDYDYDPSRPERRFISSYIHQLDFLDPVTEAVMASITFGSLACADIISKVYELAYRTDLNPGVATTIEDILFRNKSNVNGIVILTKLQGVIKFTICDFVSPTLTFDIVDPDAFIRVLSVDELDEMFVPSSIDDRW